jgi:hypothetical protein
MENRADGTQGLSDTLVDLIKHYKRSLNFHPRNYKPKEVPGDEQSSVVEFYDRKREGEDHK